MNFKWHKFNIIPSYIQMAYLLLCCTPMAVSGVETVNISINQAAENNIHTGVFGVHGELLWSNQRYGDKELVESYSALGFNGIRLPGGTTANYYRPDSGQFGCAYDLPAGSKSEKRVTQFNTALGKKNRTYRVKDFADFLLDANTPVSVVVNVACTTPEETKRWMLYFYDRGVDVGFVEFGNELYYEEFLWRFKKPRDYITAANLHLKAVKEVYPEAKTGYIVSSTAYKAGSFPDTAKMKSNKRYKRGLRYDQLSATAGVDAMVIHIYSTFGFTGLRNKLELFDNKLAYSNALAHVETRLEDAFSYLNKLDPAKEIWVTEWGLSFWGWTRKHEKGFRETCYAPLYSASLFVELLLNDKVARANYHNLPDMWHNKKGELSNIGKLFMLLKEPVLRSKKRASVTFDKIIMRASENPYFGSSIPELSGLFLYSDNKSYLFLINRFDRKYTIGDISGYPGFDAATAAIHGMAKSSVTEDCKSYNPSTLNLSAKRGLSGYIIPAYSINLIEFSQ